jgi:hypothetical protein
MMIKRSRAGDPKMRIDDWPFTLRALAKEALAAGEAETAEALRWRGVGDVFNALADVLERQRIK